QHQHQRQQQPQVQRIPHPMWRYQASPTEFGGSSWACHKRCQAQAHWRVVAEDVSKVPAADAPPSWGRQEEWLAAVRERRRAEMQPGFRAEAANSSSGGRESARCTIN
ncbi:unnamed protein product, partial [Polarella glacialis]